MKHLSAQETNEKLLNAISLCLCNDEIVNIPTKEGNVVMLSETKYKNLVESFELLKTKGMMESIEKAAHIPTSEFNKKPVWE